MNTGGIKNNEHIFKCLDVSTAHITEKDNELLGQEDIAVSVYVYEYGWFIYSGDGATSEADFTRMEEDGVWKIQ